MLGYMSRQTFVFDSVSMIWLGARNDLDGALLFTEMIWMELNNRQHYRGPYTR